MTTVYLTLGFVALFFIFMSVRLIFLKDGQFKGTCASQNPYLNKDGEACSYCGKAPGDDTMCGNPGNEVDKVLEKYK